VARDLCEKYLDFPVISWRNLFYDIANRMAEYDGEDMIEDESKNDGGKKKQTDKKK